jgi:hypothetical protein
VLLILTGTTARQVTGCLPGIPMGIKETPCWTSIQAFQGTLPSDFGLSPGKTGSHALAPEGWPWAHVTIKTSPEAYLQACLRKAYCILVSKTGPFLSSMEQV